MFLIKRVHVPNVEKLVNDDLKEAHRQHVLNLSETAMSGRLLDENGKRIGMVSVSACETWDEIRHYVYEDPYYKAGLFASVEIQALDMYLLKAKYARAPEWYEEATAKGLNKKEGSAA